MLEVNRKHTISVGNIYIFYGGFVFRKVEIFPILLKDML